MGEAEAAIELSAVLTEAEVELSTMLSAVLRLVGATWNDVIMWCSPGSVLWAGVGVVRGG